MKNNMFCPSKDCEMHNNPQGDGWYQKNGFYVTKSGSKEVKVQRLICTKCGTNFSEKTFSIHYHAKHILPLKEILIKAINCEGVRAIARSYNVTDKVISNRLKRLSYQMIAINSIIRENTSFSEDLACDGFESFVLSKYFINNIHILVGSDSQYLYGADYAPMRRKGKMTKKQKLKQKTLEKTYLPEKGAITRSFSRICSVMDDIIGNNIKNKIDINTDFKTEYVKPIKDLIGANIGYKEINHFQTLSKEYRGINNPLFPVNYFDREFRKDLSIFVRRSIRHSKNVNNMMFLVYLYGGYHNLMKPYRISPEDDFTHAQKAGVADQVLNRLLKSLFTRRHFVSHLKLNICEWKLWYRTYKTPMKRWAEDIPYYFAQ